MNRLIQDLLDTTRMETGSLPIEPARVPAAQIVLGSEESHKALVASGSLQLRVELPPELPDVWGDRDRLFQVFENLLGNAAKFTPAGGRITVGARPGEKEIVFWVADTGEGISAADVPRLFDRFWQARKGERRGAGLGLAIAKGIVEAHGGRIWVDSAPGQGSTFAFTVPTGAAGGRQGRARTGITATTISRRALALVRRASSSRICARASSPSGIGRPLSRHCTAALKPSTCA